MKFETIKNKYKKVFVYHFSEEDWCIETNTLINNFFNNKYNENIKFVTQKDNNTCSFVPCLSLYLGGELVSEVNCVNTNHFKEYLGQHYLNAECLKKIN